MLDFHHLVISGLPVPPSSKPFHGTLSNHFQREANQSLKRMKWNEKCRKCVCMVTLVKFYHLFNWLRKPVLTFIKIISLLGLTINYKYYVQGIFLRIFVVNCNFSTILYWNGAYRWWTGKWKNYFHPSLHNLLHVYCKCAYSIKKSNNNKVVSSKLLNISQIPYKCKWNFSCVKDKNA